MQNIIYINKNNYRSTRTYIPRNSKSFVESKGVVIGKILKIGDRICQSRFSEKLVKNENIIHIKPNITIKINKNVHTRHQYRQYCNI